MSRAGGGAHDRGGVPPLAGPTGVSRTGRLLDLAGLLIFLVGAAFFVRAWAGFRAVPAFVPDPAGEPWAAVRLADAYLRLQWIGGALMAMGIATFGVAWWVARRGRAPDRRCER